MTTTKNLNLSGLPTGYTVTREMIPGVGFAKPIRATRFYCDGVLVFTGGPKMSGVECVETALDLAARISDLEPYRSADVDRRDREARAWAAVQA